MSDGKKTLEKDTVYYILCGLVEQDDPVSCFRLIDKYSFGRSLNHLNNLETRINSGLRVVLPAGTVIEHWSGDGYSTTECKTPINQLSPMPVVLVDGKKREFPELLHVQPHGWHVALLDKFDLRSILYVGYLSAEERAKYHKIHDEVFAQFYGEYKKKHPFSGIKVLFGKPSGDEDWGSKVSVEAARRYLAGKNGDKKQEDNAPVSCPAPGM